MRKWVCDRCGKELSLTEVVSEFDYELCKTCAAELEYTIDKFFENKPVEFPNSEV